VKGAGRAAIKAGLEKVPVIVKNVADEQAMIMALVENLQRKDLNPIEVARACKQIIDSTGMTQEETSRSAGHEQIKFYKPTKAFGSARRGSNSHTKRRPSQ